MADRRATLSQRWILHPQKDVLIYFDEAGKYCYEIDLGRGKKKHITLPDWAMNWIFHLLGKTWVTPVTIYGLAQAFEFIISYPSIDEWRFFPLPEELGESTFRVIDARELIQRDLENEEKWAKESKRLAIEAGLTKSDGEPAC